MQLISHEELEEPNVQHLRSAILPYCIDSQGTVWVLLATTWKNKIGDFGGGCSVKKMELPVNCALREFREEIGDSVPEITRQVLNNIEDANKTHIYQATTRTFRRYFFLVEVVPSSVENFVPTKEVQSIAWHPLLQVVERPLEEYHSSTTEFFRYAKQNDIVPELTYWYAPWNEQPWENPPLYNTELFH